MMAAGAFRGRRPTRIAMRAALAGCALLLLTGGTAPPAIFSAAQYDVMAAGVDTLDNGRFRWDDGDPAAGPLSIFVNIPRQHLYAFRGGKLVGVSTVSTGKTGHRTPAGEFPILQKAQWHRSNLYSNAPMPFMQRLTWDGIALHGGALPGYPASHGCIRMPLAFAKLLFAATRVGDRVIVSASAPGALEPRGAIVPTTIAAATPRAVAAPTPVAAPDPAPRGALKSVETASVEKAPVEKGPAQLAAAAPAPVSTARTAPARAAPVRIAATPTPPARTQAAPVRVAQVASPAAPSPRLSVDYMLLRTASLNEDDVAGGLHWGQRR